MKRIFLITACLATAMLAVSCRGGAKKQQAAENAATEIAAAIEQAIDAQPEETAAQAETESGAAAMQESEQVAEEVEVQEKIDWLGGDFMIELDEIPQGVMLSVIGAPQGGSAPARKVAIKSGEALYYSTTEDGTLREFVFRKEGDIIASYLVFPQLRKAKRVESGWSSIEAILRSELGGSVWSESKESAKLVKTGSETVAGVECEIYEMSLKPEGKDAEVAAAFTALANMLGDGKKIENPLAGTDGMATMWIDPMRKKFVARRHIRMKSNGRQVDHTTHNVLFFETGGGHAHEIPDLTTYTVE